jgi:hypothetical protein
MNLIGVQMDVKFLAAAAACPWSGYAPATISFCERRLCDWVVEPANTWSNLAYVAVGCVILFLQRRRLRTALSAIGLSAVLVGIGSFAFHATGTFFGEYLDVSAMFLISALFIAFGARRLWIWPDDGLIKLYLGLVAVSMALLAAVKVSGIPMFTAQIVAASLIEIRLVRRSGRGAVDYRYLWCLIGFFAVAFTAWALDVTRVVCDPDNHLVTGHALWHVANSFCLLFFYLYQRQFFALSDL